MRPPLRDSWLSRLLGRVFWFAFGGYAAGDSRLYFMYLYVLESLHFRDMLDRGTRLSAPVPFRSAFARARQSLWQRLIFLTSFIAPLIAFSVWLLAFSPQPRQPISVEAARNRA